MNEADSIAAKLELDRAGTQQYRRESDAVVTQLVSDVDALKGQMIANTALTQEVRDILGSFKIIGTLAKWAAAIVGSCMGAYHFVTALLGRGQP